MSRHTPLRVAFRRPWPGTRRGLCLWLFSIAWITLGLVQYIGTTVPEITQQYLAFPFDFAPPPFWGGVFIAVGAFALWSAYCHFGRDRYGFTTLAVFCLLWGGAFVCGFFFYDAPVRALGASIIYFLFAAILMIIAGFPNVSLRPEPYDKVEDRNTTSGGLRK